MGSTIISWTPTNWVTVFLMAAGGYIIVRTAVSSYKKYQSNRSAA